jgi:hypothetical protein
VSRARQLLEVLLDEDARQAIIIYDPEGNPHKATFDGFQWLSRNGYVAQITPQEDLPGITTSKSTLYSVTLTRAGYILPALPDPPEESDMEKHFRQQILQTSQEK